MVVERPHTHYHTGLVAADVEVVDPHQPSDTAGGFLVVAMDPHGQAKTSGVDRLRDLSQILCGITYYV